MAISIKKPKLKKLPKKPKGQLTPDRLASWKAKYDETVKENAAKVSEYLKAQTAAKSFEKKMHTDKMRAKKI
jgi:hypothetical protein